MASAGASIWAPFEQLQAEAGCQQHRVIILVFAIVYCIILKRNLGVFAPPSSSHSNIRGGEGPAQPIPVN